MTRESGALTRICERALLPVKVRPPLWLLGLVQRRRLTGEQVQCVVGWGAGLAV